MGYITLALVFKIPLYMSLVPKTSTRRVLTHDSVILGGHDQSYPGVRMIWSILPTSHFIYQGVRGQITYLTDIIT